MHAETESCHSYIMFHWIVATHKEIQLNSPCRHRPSFRGLEKAGLLYCMAGRWIEKQKGLSRFSSRVTGCEESPPATFQRAALSDNIKAPIHPAALQSDAEYTLARVSLQPAALNTQQLTYCFLGLRRIHCSYPGDMGQGVEAGVCQR